MSRVTPSIGLVTRYWCAIGTTGTVSPTIAPISCAQMPPASTTTSQRTVPSSVSTPATRRPSALTPRTFTPVRVLTPRFRAPAARDVASEDGSIRPSVGKYAAASTPSMLINGNSSRASRAEISVRGSPNVLAHPT
jgi:hypothetical protein